MSEKKKYQSDLCERLLQFAIDIIKFLGTIPRNEETNIIKYQLSKSASSMGANYEESQSTTKREFPAKIRISVREGRESIFWLKIIRGLKLGDEIERDRLLNEATELTKILRSILKKTE